jgi:hypothetical protein
MSEGETTAETPETTTLIVVTSSSRSTDKGMRSTQERAGRLMDKGIPVDQIHQNYARFLDSMRAIFAKDAGRVGDFVLEEITFSAEIGANGEFKLLGTGVGVTANSGVTFTLRRKPRRATRTD